MRRLETIQTEAKNSAACSVEISPEFIAPSLASGVPAPVPMPPMTIAAMPILRSQGRAFDFVPMFRYRLLSLRQLCLQRVSGSCRSKPRFVAIWFRNRRLFFRMQPIRTFV
ncbi:hypothetical protein [Mesorhizobium sp. M0276]|uniref:hypothetical protein n=1 Tax=Mesorhizobium sp. M0276 TaxID=2956928 RepID=UPI00333B7773